MSWILQLETIKSDWCIVMDDHYLFISFIFLFFCSCLLVLFSPSFIYELGFVSGTSCYWHRISNVYFILICTSTYFWHWMSNQLTAIKFSFPLSRLGIPRLVTFLQLNLTSLNPHCKLLPFGSYMINYCIPRHLLFYKEKLFVALQHTIIKSGELLSYFPT